MDGGSIYWVIKGVIQVRQRLLAFDEGHKDDGSPCCLLVYDRALVPVRPTPRRPSRAGAIYPPTMRRPISPADASDDMAKLPRRCARNWRTSA